MYYFFIDESGDHNLLKINKDFPLFILAGCIFKSEYYNSICVKEIHDFKLKIFGNKKIILHTADITRNRNGFEKLQNEVSRNQFYREINYLLNKLDFTLIACIVDKKEHFKKFGELAYDPYELALKCVLERYFYFLQENNDTGKIFVESRGGFLDSKLELAYFDIKLSGITYPTRKLTGSDLKKRFIDFKFLNKKQNVCGLQVADLCATPIGRDYLGKTVHEDYKIIKSKFRTRNGDFYRCGLIIVPEEFYPKK